MEKYRVLMTRTRTIKERALVEVIASSEHYAKRDAEGVAMREVAWKTERDTSADLHYLSCEEI